MTKLKMPDDLDIKVEKLRYVLTNLKPSQKHHVNIPDELLTQAKAAMQAKTDYNVTITNQTLVKYALLNLLDPALQNRLRHRLQDYHACLSLTKLLAVNNDPRQSKSSQLTNDLLDVKEKQHQHDILLETILSALAWLIYDRNGLDKLPIAQDSNDIFSKLRQDQLKAVIDAMLAAGLDETERQRHLDNLG